MEISNTKTFDPVLMQGTGKPAALGAMNAVKTEIPVKQENAKNKPDESTRELGAEEMSLVNEELNKFMQSLNTDIQFVMHDGTGRLMVQVVDMKEGKVLKEFPPKELLDTLAAIREYVGALLDKRV